MKITLLGTGTSHGVPMIGCDCEVCTSTDPKDKRTRVGLYVESDGVRVLVDTPPELRLQCLSNHISRIDAVLFTHHHADHITGLDDLRRFNWLQKSAISCYAQPDDIRGIMQMFSYAFRDDPDYPSQKPDLRFFPIEGPLDIHSATEPERVLRVLPIPLMHGPTRVLGFRFGAFAYCTDCSEIPESSLNLLCDLDVLVLDALRRRPHRTHFNLQQAVEMAQRIGARQTYFTHIAHELLHDRTNRDLPPAMQLAYDGQVIQV